MEIEKKFLVEEMPENLNRYSKKEIEQGYLSSRNPVLRVRRSNNDYFLTYKSRYGILEANDSDSLISNEVELPISSEAYYHLLEKSDYNIIRKTRYLIPLEDNLTAELDVFHEILEGLIFLEVEFTDELSAKNFIPPSWFGQDVTLNDSYKNNYLIRIDNISELIN